MEIKSNITLQSTLFSCECTVKSEFISLGDFCFILGSCLIIFYFSTLYYNLIISPPLFSLQILLYIPLCSLPNPWPFLLIVFTYIYIYVLKYICLSIARLGLYNIACMCDLRDDSLLLDSLFSFLGKTVVYRALSFSS